ncbi:hypothetical protein [Fimbriimonas ginsengisoli]|uniref:Tail sheath protein subtilisin-like domain-containing protein n=1 Tax=Fimbriimonas ginsengisoli Gsoil 348 TaxID=661478 RepID=A0A068NXW1_FIMGI|nr:hypothetical protein [Fimbriimonas ginsengisoli]AIE86489.1 hypothetical protein OP10G_3121 [Fimbriimonas ginsengisoli Gsoil 348]
MAVPVAYPFVEVFITPPPTPIAQRSPGVIAIVGKTPAGADGGLTPANVPVEIVTMDDAVTSFAKKNPDGSVAATTLYNSIALAFLQDPKPSKIYGVRVAADNYAAALASLEGVGDVTFVSLANDATLGAPAAGATPPTGLQALKAHVESMSSQGAKRIGVAMVNPATAKSPTYAADVIAALTAPNTLKSDVSRMIMVAARGATGDVATAAMAAIAGFSPQTSIVLKKIRGISIPNEQRFSPSEIIALSNANIIPIIHPALIVGESLHFGEGRLFTTDASLLFVDLVRVIDDVDFKLQAGLVGMIGDSRITKAGLTQVKARITAILDPLVGSAELDDYHVEIPILNMLQIPESARTAAEELQISDARANRVIDVYVTIVYGPAIHRLRVNLAVKF